MGLAADLLLPAPTDRCRLPDGGSWDWALDAAWEEVGSPDEDPLSVAGWRRLRALLQEPVDGGAGMNRYLLAAVSRPDLASWLTDPTGTDRALALEWAWASGVKEGLDPDLLPPPAVPLDLARRLELRSIPARRIASRLRRSATSTA